MINLMEICGTHTHAIAKAGIKNMLPDGVKLLSGPGCPVCVTPQESIDTFLELAMNPSVIITTYGDMVRVPGSIPGDNLALRRARGANVKVVYSPIDAINIAKENPDKEVVFLGVGFETTAPGTASAIGVAVDEGVMNFSIYSMLKLVKPALCALVDDPAFDVQGFIVPGHVAVIIGEDGFRYIQDELHIPAIITGFEPDDIWKSICRLLDKIDAHDYTLENGYKRLVRPHGNELALSAIDRYLTARDDTWRGLGRIPQSGLGIRPEYSKWDAEMKFNLTKESKTDTLENKVQDLDNDYKKITALCKCGEVIKGAVEPSVCPLFGKRCTPDDPVGPCMVSGEGACSASYKYRDI